MKKQIVPLIALAFAAASCTNTTTNDSQSAGIRMENMDTTAIPGADFYQYATGGWAKLNPITDEYSRFGSFDKLAENSRLQVQSLVEEIAKSKNSKGTDAQRIGDLYNIVMDSTRRNADAINPIKADIEAIDALTSPAQLPAFFAKNPYADYFFSMYVEANVMNAKEHILYTYQSGLGMGQRDYYLDETETMQNIRAEYRKHIANMFTIANCADQDAAVEAVMEIETRLATAHYDPVKLRNTEENYHLLSIEELETEVPGFDFKTMLTGLGANVDRICLSQPEPVKEAVNIINNTDFNKVKLYLKWQLINAAAGYLNDDMAAESFNFYGRVISGAKEQSPRWKKAIAAVNNSLGEAVGHLYVEKYFPAEAKARMEALVQNLLTAYGERIDKLEWMSDETKAKAHEKLATFYVKVGYPNSWQDYSTLEINPEDSYWENSKRIARFSLNVMFEKLAEPVDKDKWLMTPQTVNAYYNPTTNEICFPAAILQYPFFDMSADDAFNYGAIGVVIAHEVTHGFDDQGCNFDKEGNFNNWWTAEDKARFEERTLVMDNYFDNIEVADGLFANGAFTLGENIADHGGLQVAFHALSKVLESNPLPVKDGFTAQQRFFIAYSNVWAGNIRPEEIIRRTKTDPHSLGEWRVNGALPHINGWYDAFNITEKDPLYLAPEKRVSIW